MTNQFLDDLRLANMKRQSEWPGAGAIQGPMAKLFRSNELAGELGKLANNVKKAVREELGIGGSRVSRTALEEEFGDVLICLDLLAKEFEVDLIEVALNKFNKTSTDQGLKTRIQGIY